MAPLIVMLVSWLVARSIGVAVMWHHADSWTGALRIALAVMFVFTAMSHFHPRTRPDLIRMVPPGLPAPRFLVTDLGTDGGGLVPELFPKRVQALMPGSGESACF